MSLHKTILRLSAIYAFSASFLAIAPSALAATFIPSADNKSVFVASGGAFTNGVKAFDINFDGNIDGTSNTALSSIATFRYVKHEFLNTSNPSQTRTEATFEITLKNTSTAPLTSSRTSVLGFDVDPNLTGVGSTNTSGNTRVTGIFNADNSGRMGNFGNVEVCFFQSGGNCSGGANGGVTQGNTGVFTAVLAFTGKVYNFTLSNLGVRYQSIDGTVNGKKLKGASGTGKGFFQARQRPRRVFEPGTASALGLFALGAFLAKKKNCLSSI